MNVAHFLLTHILHKSFIPKTKFHLNLSCVIFYDLFTVCLYLENKVLENALHYHTYLFLWVIYEWIFLTSYNPTVAWPFASCALLLLAGDLLHSNSVHSSQKYKKEGDNRVAKEHAVFPIIILHSNYSSDLDIIYVHNTRSSSGATTAYCIHASFVTCNPIKRVPNVKSNVTRLLNQKTGGTCSVELSYR